MCFHVVYKERKQIRIYSAFWGIADVVFIVVKCDFLFYCKKIWTLFKVHKISDYRLLSPNMSDTYSKTQERCGNVDGRWENSKARCWEWVLWDSGFWTLNGYALMISLSQWLFAQAFVDKLAHCFILSQEMTHYFIIHGRGTHNGYFIFLSKISIDKWWINSPFPHKT